MYETDPGDARFHDADVTEAGVSEAGHDTPGGDPMVRPGADPAGGPLDPEGLNTPNRVAPEDTSAIPSDTQPVADNREMWAGRPGKAPDQASDQSEAPIPDVMGGVDEPAPDVMGNANPLPDEALGDRGEGDRA